MSAVITKLNTSVHRNIMLKILLSLSYDLVLSRNLVFKGGTALYFLYGLDRFSTDLDFDLVDLSQEDTVLKKIGNILKKYGELKDLRIKKHTIFALLSYGEIDHNIKIEINRRGISGSYTYKNFLGIELQIMDLQDMCANKFIALTDRNKLANRDIYDIHFMITKGYEINKDLIAKRTGKPFKEYMQYCIEFLKDLPDNYQILDGLGLVLDQKQKTFCKTKLIKETIFLLHTYL